MILILDGNLEIGAHARNNLCYLIFLTHLIRSQAVKNRIIFAPKGSISLYACAKCSELPSNMNSMVNTV